ncbi:MAG: hypothetical protein FWC11_03520 [Firmicutes bacterium]|nr:hypothetical protein [Bacillota bacterium]MCL2255910.1 hypothetical protein [Bacillota bacterium]
MANVVNAKKNKIKPENITNTQAEVIKCKYAGERSFGIGPMARVTHFYTIVVRVNGIDKPLKIKVKEKPNWNVGIAQDIKSVGKMFGKDRPVNEGDILNVVYDASKPKKIFLQDAPEQEQPQQ